ncbi:MAG TPA: chrolohydrolase [Legionella sp.]|nr:chrolohydrolase [Legionella sp.]
MALLIKDGILITVDPAFRVFSKGSILIEDDKIVALGATEDVIAAHSGPFTEIDARGKIIAPGLISVHNHLGYTVFRGRAEDVGAKPTPSLFLPMKQIITQQERKTFAALGATELLAGGVTTVLEMEEDANIIAPFLEQLGIRAGLAIMTNDVDIPKLLNGETSFDASLRQHQINQSIELIETWHNRANKRFKAFVAANMALSCSAPLLQALREVADRYSIGVTYHVGLGAYEVDLIQKLHGCSPFEFANRMGFLGKDAILAHCHYMNDADISLLAASGAYVAHCPVLNSLRGASAPVPLMLQKGIPIALGLDNYFADYYDVMRACIAVARVKAQDAHLLSAKDVLRFATIEAAKAMGIDQVTGSLEVGKKADIQLINIRKLGICPVTDPVSSLIYHAHAQDVDTVIVDGKILVSGGKVLSVNENDLIEEAQQCSDALWARFAKTYASNSQVTPITTY